MPIHAGDLHKLDAFKKLVAPDQYVATRILVSFSSTRFQDEFRLHTARVFFQTVTLNIEEFHVRTSQLFAGRFALDNSREAVDQFIEQTTNGMLETPWGKVPFWGINGQGSNVFVTLEPLHEAGLQNQRRISVLQFSGEPVPHPSTNRTVDWELRASETPFESVDELYSVLSLQRDLTPSASIEFVAYQTVAINFDASGVEDDQLTVVVHISKGLSPAGFSLGLRSLVDGNVNRSQLKSDSFTWNDRDEYIEGVAQLPANGAHAIQCFANYKDINYGSSWLIDKSISVNTRCAAFKAFDRDLEKTRRELFPDDGSKERAREFETAVSWLFWMLGFSPIPLDGQFGLPDAPDFIFVDELGQALLVDCTTGRISVNDKLEKLAERHSRLRSTLRANRAEFVTSYAVVISRGQFEVPEADLERAKRNEVIVVSSKELALLFESLSSPKRPSEILQALTSNSLP